MTGKTLSLRMQAALEIIECSRDAPQGIKPRIPHRAKLIRVQALPKVQVFTRSMLEVLHHRSHYPQMRDTAVVTGSP